MILRGISIYVMLAFLQAGADSGNVQTDAGNWVRPEEYATLLRHVEYVCGKKFKKEPPFKDLTTEVVREMVDNDIRDSFPNDSFAGYQAAWTWLGLLPKELDLRACLYTLHEREALGMYDPVSKNIYVKQGGKVIPKHAEFDFTVIEHEFVHALDDQYQDIYAIALSKVGNSDAGAAYSATLEGHATRKMIECFPLLTLLEPQDARKAELEFLMLDSWLESPAADFILSSVFSYADRLMPKVEGVPDPLIKQMAGLYSYGYVFIRSMSTCWGQDAVTMVFRNPPQSTEQVMHPEKYWLWRDWPTTVAIPAAFNLDGGAWRALYEDTLGEMGMKIFFDHHLGEGAGSGPAAGWGGDRYALYTNQDGKHLFVWATSWDTAHDAWEFLHAYKTAQQRAFAAVMADGGGHPQWQRPDGVTGLADRKGRRVLIVESDATVRPAVDDLRAQITFAEPLALQAERAERNNALLRYNPLISYETDGDSSSGDLLVGLLASRQRSPVGTRTRLLRGFLMNACNSVSYQYLSWFGGLVACLEADSTRDLERGAVLPLGLLWGENRSAHPSTPNATIANSSLLWGLLYNHEACSVDSVYELLPYGALFRYTAKPDGERKARVFGVRVYHGTAALPQER